MATVAELIDRSRGAYAALAEVGEQMEDAWPYVVDLHAAWLAELDSIEASRGSEPATEDTEAALDQLIEEIGRIADPHRAIDWLSTFPQAVLLALMPR